MSSLGGFEKIQPAWDREFRLTTGMVGRDLRKRARLVERAAKKQVGKDTHNLEHHIGTTLRPGIIGPLATVGVTVEPGIGYAYWHHQGTRPHIISARPPHTHLRFRGRGGTAEIFPETVRHPGTKANKYLADNLPLAVL